MAEYQVVIFQAIAHEAGRYGRPAASLLGPDHPSMVLATVVPISEATKLKNAAQTTPVSATDTGGDNSGDRIFGIVHCAL